MPSIPDWLGISAYLAVAALCLWAAFASPARAAKPTRLHWIGISAALVALAAWRLLQIEEFLRSWLRTEVIGDAYDTRYEFQGPAAAIVILGGLAILALAAWQLHRRPLPVILSSLAIGGFAGLIAIRIVSIHILDRLIYSGIGPVRINYLIELGLLATIVYGVYLYRAEPAQPPTDPHRRRTRRG
ncbi:hypothetical protein ACXYL9_04980 [Qipengyuania sp. CAU 1752]